MQQPGKLGCRQMTVVLRSGELDDQVHRQHGRKARGNLVLDCASLKSSAGATWAHRAALTSTSVDPSQSKSSLGRVYVCLCSRFTAVRSNRTKSRQNENRFRSNATVVFILMRLNLRSSWNDSQVELTSVT